MRLRTIPLIDRDYNKSIYELIWKTNYLEYNGKRRERALRRMGSDFCIVLNLEAIHKMNQNILNSLSNEYSDNKNLVDKSQRYLASFASYLDLVSTNVLTSAALPSGRRSTLLSLHTEVFNEIKDIGGNLFEFDAGLWGNILITAVATWGDSIAK